MKKKIFFEDFDSLYYFHGSTWNWEMKGMHFHKQYELLLVMSEGMRLEIGNRIYEVGKGDLFFINNKEYHRMVGQKGAAYERYVLMFDPEIIRKLSEILDYDFTELFDPPAGDGAVRLHLSDGNLRKTEELLGEVEQEISKDSGDRHNRLQLKLKLIELLNTMDSLYEKFYGKGMEETGVVENTSDEDVSPVPYRERIEQIKKFIADHVEERLNLDEIADRFYINRYYLSHYFKTETGFTLTQYITNQKISAAKKLLMNGMSVTDVALQLSYKSDSHFISVFKKNTGITPKQYAKQEKNSKNA